MQQSLFPDSPSPARKNKADDCLGELNPSQYEAVTSIKGPVLVIAGAGTGKTRTLVHRTAHLVQTGIPPENILLLTFTRKAAREMICRASLLMDESCRRVAGGTFHATANMLLRRFGHHLGFERNFTILDRPDAEGIISLLKSSLDLSGAGKRFPSKRVIMDIFSKSVNKSTSIDELIDRQYSHLILYLDDLHLIGKHYKKYKLEHGLMDYDDLLVNWQRLLAEIPEVREAISNRFTHIMVDEYQDTNLIQADIIRLTAAPLNNVMVVGDDSQSIYSFRGADFRNIMDFPRIFPDVKLIKLEENYRSSQAILTVTNSIIENSSEKYTKKLFSRIEGGIKPIIYSASNETTQARYVIGKIEDLVNEGVPIAEIAVLFRSGFHSYRLEMELISNQINFEKRGGMKLTESAHIKDVLSFLRVLSNPGDNISWNRILLMLDKVGPKTAGKVLWNIKTADDPFDALLNYPAGKSWKQGLNNLAKMLLSLREPEIAPTALFDRVMVYYDPIFKKIFHDDYPRRSRDLEQLGIILAGYHDLQSFIDDTTLDPPENIGNPGDPHFNSTDRLVLSTIHSAKGLEWDTVFVIHLAEGKFPSVHALLSDQLEEERRLMYVAATRAKHRLFFTYPREGISADFTAANNTISPFLNEIPTGLVSSPSIRSYSGHAFPREKTGFQEERPKAVKQTMGHTSFYPGMKVRHPFFGEGSIKAVKGPKTVEVYFPRHGKKTLRTDYTKLEILQ